MCLGFLACVTLAGAASASAQTGGSGGSGGSGGGGLCTPNNPDAGTVAVGESGSVVLCGDFTPGDEVDITVNGDLVGQQFAQDDGSVTVDFDVVSITSLEIDSQVSAPGMAGLNTIVGTGPGDPGTSTGTFTVVASTSGGGGTGGTGGTGTGGSGTLPLTGEQAAFPLAAAAGIIVLVLAARQVRRRTHV